MMIPMPIFITRFFDSRRPKSNYAPATQDQLDGKAGFLWGRGTPEEKWCKSTNAQAMEHATKQLQEMKFTGTYEFPVSAYDHPSSVSMIEGKLVSKAEVIEYEKYHQCAY